MIELLEVMRGLMGLDGFLPGLGLRQLDFLLDNLTVWVLAVEVQCLDTKVYVMLLFLLLFFLGVVCMLLMEAFAIQ